MADLERDTFTWAMLGGAAVVGLGLFAFTGGGGSDSSLSGPAPADAPTTSVAATTTTDPDVPDTAKAGRVLPALVVGDGSFEAVTGDEQLSDGNSVAAIGDARADGAGFLVAGADGRRLVEVVTDAVRSDDALVLVVGGAADAAAPSDLLELADAALSAIDAARAAAPSAEVVLVGPLTQTGDGQRLSDVREVLGAVAVDAGVEFRDPIGEDWLVDGDVDPGGSLTATGQRRVETELRRLVRVHLAAG